MTLKGLKCTLHLCSFLIIVAECADFVADNYQINRVDLSPFNDAVLFNDIAEIINDFDSNMHSPSPSESESEENIEDLLSEYQHYLDKAHKQKKSYEDKLKNKVPLIRHEKFSKMKTLPGNKYSDYFNSLSNTFGLSERPPNNQLDLFVPLNPDLKYFLRPELYNSQFHKNNRDDKEKIFTDEKQLVDINSLSPRPNYDTLKSPCICKDDQIPCDCNCKQCIISLDAPYSDSFSRNTDLKEYEIPLSPSPFIADNTFDNSEVSNRLRETSDNDLNIRVKVDVMLPKIFESILKQKSRHREKIIQNDNRNSKEKNYLINAPLSKFNYPLPVDVFGFQKPMRLNKHDSTSLHKLTIHKKKKSKLSNNNNKKHKKKIITFHNIKFEPRVIPLVKLDENYNNHNANMVLENNNLELKTPLLKNYTLKMNALNLKNQSIPITPNTSIKTIIASTSETSLITSIIENKNDFNKSENSIEIDFAKTIPNISTELPPIFRSKRSVITQTTLKIIGNDSLHAIKEKNKEINPMKNLKEYSKILSSDSELLYWPNITKIRNNTNFKNITEIILERENSKVKLNMSQETIRKNHTIALEHAIFGNVDWNDVDTVAPVFMSFMGKYIKGILTFCSQKICHSMKCSEKTCVHRICTPEERFNQRGHCNGSNETDSVATMEAIMDLPSNIAFEIVDILQDKMLGKIFGKATFCISSKCISLVAAKKTFIKSKCSLKELDLTGHCLNLKHSKIM